MHTPPSPASPDSVHAACKMENTEATVEQKKYDHLRANGKILCQSPSSDAMSKTQLDDLRLLRKSSFRMRALPASPVQKSHYLRKSKSVQIKFDADDMGSSSAVSGASSASLGFSLSFAGFPATNEDAISSKNAFSDDETQSDQEEENQKTVLVEATLPIYLMFTGLKYKVIVKGLRISTEKEILNGIGGSANPGEMLALMGPSGSGKTTLLNLLGGRIGSKLVGGSITYNDQPYSKSLKSRIGFVTQDDVLFAHLTVKETLTYAALLRLPKTMTRKEKEKRAIDVIYRLGLERCQDTIVGGPFVRGISGGERKRVCIGNEVIINPSMLFLDEPTSGLDSTTALRMVQMLHDIAEAGKTVITTIHQPSSRLFYKFDKLILLGKGSLLYFGKASEVVAYFSSIGCSPLLAMNPAEFLLDLANGNLTGISVPSKLKDKMEMKPEKNGKHQKPSPTDVHNYLVEAYETRAADEEKRNNVVPFAPNQDIKWEIPSSERQWGASWWQQFSILFWRGLRERRHEYLSSMRITQVLATAVIIGFLWWRSDSTTPKGLQDQAGLLFFISVFWGFFPVVIAIFTFPQERAMLNKERAADMYKMSSYFMARTLGDMPLDLILPIIFLTIVYFMANLKLLLAPFFLSMMVVFLSILASQGLGLAIGAIVMDIKKATTLASITIMTFMLAGGFFVKRVPIFISWIQYLSFTYHTYRLLLKVQYGQVPEFLNKVDPQYVVKDVCAMIAMAVGYRVLAYIALRRMKLKP